MTFGLIWAGASVRVRERELAAGCFGLPDGWGTHVDPDPLEGGGGASGSVSQAGRSQRAPSGGTRTTAENGRPCQGTSSACTEPMLPTPEPP